MKRYETYVESNLMTGETRSWTAEEPNGQWVKFTEAQAIVKQAREALAGLLFADEDPIPPGGPDIAAWAERLAAARAKGRSALAALDAFGEGE